MSEADLVRTKRSIRRHLMMGGGVALLLFGGIGGWSVMASIAGAVVAPGTVVVQSSKKHVQHLDGGLVAEIRVQDGDRVGAGDVVIRLDATQTLAERAALGNRIAGLQLRRTRLLAEHKGLEVLSFPAGIIKQADAQDELKSILEGQRYLFQTRREMRLGGKAQVNEQVRQLEAQIRGLEAIRSGKDAELIVLRRELKGLRVLRDKKLVPASRLNALERDAAKTEGELGSADCYP